MDELRAMGFRGVVGYEMSPTRAARARERGFDVIAEDLHEFGADASGPRLDAAIASHSMEHLLAPTVAISAIVDRLAPGGYFFVALPYPDVAAADARNIHRARAHVGSVALGLDRYDNARTTRIVFERHGLRLVNRSFHDEREDEVWLAFVKSV